MAQDDILFSTRDDVLHAPCRFGLLVVPDFISHVQSWCSHAASRVLTLDLSDVGEFEMPAFRSLVWARRQLEAMGRELVLIMPPRGVFEAHEEEVIRDLF